MADISTITLPDGSQVDIKDATARSGLVGKVDINQGLQNAGKVLAVGSNGAVTLTDPSAGTGDVTGPNVSTDANVAVFDGATGKAIKDSGYTIGKSVPSNAVFTDTTYESKAAVSGGTAESLVTTGEKYTWNNKAETAVATTSANGLMSSTDKSKLDGIAAGATANTGTITGIKMNGASKGTSGVVDLGTVITAHQDISGKLNASEKGAAGGVAELDAEGKVPSSQLPSYVDDVLEYTTYSGFPATGETGKIYIAQDTNKTYRWGGSAYVEISASLALGETSSTAYRGDRGKTAYDHASAKGSAFSSGLYKITTNAQGHVTAATAVEKSDITGLGIPGSDTTYSNATQSAAGLMSSTDKTKLDGVATGATANVGTITGITMNGASKGTSGVVDLGTVITAHQDISGKVDKVSGKGLSTNDYTTTEKDKLSGIASGAEVNQNAFSNVTVGSTTISADTKTDTLTLVAGSNVTITPDATNDTITIAATDTNTWRPVSDSVSSTSSSDAASSKAVKTAYDLAASKTANVGTITGITMNGASKGTSGVVDLGTVITAHQDISGKVSGPASATNNAVAIFDGTGGKTIKNSGFTIGKSVPSDAVFTDTTYTFDGTYNASTNKAATVSTVTNAINALDGNLNSTTPGAGKTLTAFSETNGIVSATFGNISITKSQVSDFPTSMTPASHTHGNIQNGGTLQTTDVAIASGDKLVVTDSSDSNKVARTSLSFDGSTATKALTQKGTWESFTNNAGTITGITMNGASKGTSGVVDLGTVITAHQDISGKVSGPSSATNNAVAIFDGTGGKTIKNSGYTIGKSVPSDAVFTDTTYSAATTSAAGLMSTTDKTKLDGIATGATANSISVASGTVAAGSWSSATPPTQTISVTGVTASNNVIVGIAPTITADQYEAACSAKLVCTEQGAGTLTFTCYGDKPTENIPLSVVILG